MKIEDMGYKEIEERKSAINKSIGADNLSLEDLQKLNSEVDKLELRKKEIAAHVAEEKELELRAINAQAGDEGIKIIAEKRGDENKMNKEQNLGYESVEYRNAFLKNLMGQDLTEVEERAFVHTTANTSAVLPKELQNKIYSNMEEAHPILADVQVLRSGTAISIAKHTAIVAGDAKVVAEGVANDDEQNTFVNVTLVGKKFSKHIDISYELGAMSVPAFESYLIQEIGARLGAAMASEIVRQVKADLAVANKVEAATPGTLVLKDILKGLASLKGAGKVYVYANNATFYGSLAQLDGDAGRVSFIPNYQENISGQLLGKGIKEEDAVDEGEILILDPTQFLWNEVQGITFEQDRDIKKGVRTIAGHAIAGGSMTNDKAGALITVGAAA